MFEFSVKRKGTWLEIVLIQAVVVEEEIVLVTRLTDKKRLEIKFPLFNYKIEPMQCGEAGHISRDCPTGGGGGGPRTCNKVEG